MRWPAGAGIAETFDAFLTYAAENHWEAATGSIMKQAGFLFALAMLLSACALQAKMNELDQMNASKAAYKECLIANPGKVSACQAEQLSYEADLKAYEATAEGMTTSR
jgi:hypothetical protein